MFLFAKSGKHRPPPPRVRGMLGSLLPGSWSQVLLQPELPWQPEQALLELCLLTSPASPRPCPLHAPNMLSYFQFPECVMLLLASALSTRCALCPSSSLSPTLWLIPIDPESLHSAASLLPGSLPGTLKPAPSHRSLLHSPCTALLQRAGWVTGTLGPPHPAPARGLR